MPFGTTLDYTRDSAFRVTSRTGTDGSSLAFTYGPMDRVETATDETGTVTHEYDAVGRMTGLVHPNGARVGRSYDAIDQTRHITVRPSATGTVRDTEYVYDAANRLSEVHDPLGGVTSYAYDDDSRLTSRTLPNGVTTTWTYNARGWVMSVTHRRADTTVIASRTYERSPSGEPTRITNHDGSYVLITYDDALRVESEAYRAADDSVIDNIEYTYDLDGNRTTRRRGATIATSTLEEYTYAAGDELTTVTVAGTPTQTWEHDNAGRTTRITRSGHDQHLAYDADDHITSIVDGAAETRWQFDAEGRRTRREDLSGGVTDSAHRYVQGPTTDASLDSAHMVTTDAGAEELAYVFAPIPGGAEHPLFRYDPTTGEAVYYLQDSMGSVIGLVDQTTTQTAIFEYDGFGGERSATGALASLPVASRGDYRFHGMWLDSSVGLYYVRARVYDAEVGRFLSNDPAEGRRVAPESFEGSRFARNNAWSMRDPSGRMFGSVLEAMSAVTIRMIAATTIGFASGAAGSFISNLRGWGCGQAGDERGISTEELLWRTVRGAFLNAALSFLGQAADEFLESENAARFIRFVVAVARNLFFYFVSQRAARGSVSRTGVILAILVTVGQAAYETGFDADPVSRLWEAFRTEIVTNFVWTSVFTSIIDAAVAYDSGDICGKGYFVP